jgi:hypothetical protein
MKLLRFTEEQLNHTTAGIILQYDFIEPIDDKYNVYIECEDYNNGSQFKVTIFWQLGCSESDSDEVISDNNYFIIHKTESLRKFTKEVNDILDVIVSKPFDSELSDDEFNQLKND